jgi:ABC-2 type transport system permease protein
MTTQTKSAVQQDLILAARTGLLPVNERTWLGGFVNLLGKELGQWWGTRTWWIQILMWVFIINGITSIVMLTDQIPRQEMMQEIILVFSGLGAMAVAIGVVTAVQNAVVGEKQLGTAAWILSKPASRSAFILAKAITYTIGFWTAGIFIPAIIFIVETRLVLQTPFPIVPFLANLAVLELSVLFYIALTLMAGTLFNSRGAIAGLGIGFLMGGFALKNLLPPIYLIATPWLLSDIGSALALGQSLPPYWFVPIIATSVEIVIMLTVALWRFQREEF